MVLPPFIPSQLQFQGPAPVTAEGEPAAHRFTEGAAANVCELDEPHVPLTGRGAMVMLWVSPGAAL
jgi:hypothetical protein